MSAVQPDLSEFLKLSKPKKRPCALGGIREALKPAERKTLDAALETSQNTITNTAIVQWLKARGHETNVPRVLTHRKGTCNCGQQA